jgi:hypothetical protein
MRAVAGRAHHGDDLLDGGRIRRVAQALFAGERPAWNPGFVAGDRRRPARSSISSDMTPPRARRNEPELALRHQRGTATDSTRTIGPASKRQCGRPKVALLLFDQSATAVVPRPAPFRLGALVLIGTVNAAPSFSLDPPRGGDVAGLAGLGVVCAGDRRCRWSDGAGGGREVAREATSGAGARSWRRAGAGG